MKSVPNILSSLRILLAPLFVFMYLQPELIWSALSIAVFAVAAVTDYFDGLIARLYKVKSDTGMFLDPLADKFLTFSGFICLPFIDPGQFPWWVIGIIFARDIFITLMRILGEKRGIRMVTSYSAKVKTSVQMIFLYLVLLAGVFIKTDIRIGEYSRILLESGILGILLYGVMIITVYTGIEYIRMNKHLFRGPSA
ncbi:MAG: CDP-alcohol phosphatidyltransferase family protein [Balneolales bacterium]